MPADYSTDKTNYSATRPESSGSGVFFILGAIVVALGVVIWLVAGSEPDSAVPADQAAPSVTINNDAAAPDAGAPAASTPAPTETAPEPAPAPAAPTDAAPAPADAAPAPAN